MNEILFQINRKSIADIAGIKEALSAYKEFVAKNGKEPELLGLEEFSDEKLFYLAFANVSIGYRFWNVPRKIIIMKYFKLKMFTRFEIFY